LLLLISSKALRADQRIKNPSKLKTGLEGCDILFGRDRTAHQSTVFFIWWALCHIQKCRAFSAFIFHHFALLDVA
jgi:hypothetical protein